MKKILTILTIFISLFSTTYAVQDLLPLQGTVYNSSGSPINNGDVQVVIYDAPTGGDLIYNSSTDFNDDIVNGQYDILLGSGSVNLTLEYGEIYYIDIIINGEDIDFNGNERQMFQSSVGEVKKTNRNNVANGTNSFAGGENSIASGDNSFAFGSSTISTTEATETSSFAFGSNVHVYEPWSHAFGLDSHIYSSGSFLVGEKTVISGLGSVFLGGSMSHIYGDRSFLHGSNTEVYGNDSFIIRIGKNNSDLEAHQSNTFAVMGGNSGFGISSPQRTVHIKDVMKLEPMSSHPQNASLGDLYVNNESKEVCFYNGNFWEGMTGNVCYIASLNISTLYSEGEYAVGGYEGIKINETVIEVYNIVDENEEEYAYLSDNTDSFSFSPKESMGKKVYFNETSDIGNYYLKITDLVESTQPTNKGYILIDFVNVNEENVQNGNELYLGEASNDVFNIGGEYHNISVHGVSRTQSSVFLTIDGETRTQDINNTYTYGAYDWTLNNITKNKGELGRYYINIIRE